MLTYKNSVSFRKGESPPMVFRNFFEPEDGFIWSTSCWSELIFSFSDSVPPKVRTLDLILDVDVFKAPPELATQTVKFYLNGIRIGTRDLKERTMTLLPFNPALLKTSENVLTFDTPNSSVPAAFGVSDERRLGLQLFSIQVRPGE